jgi:hypothetical protein
MTTTTQTLSGSEQQDYINIQKNIETRGTKQEKDEFRDLRAKIVDTVVSGNSSVQGDIANQVRARIVFNPKYDQYKKP